MTFKRFLYLGVMKGEAMKLSGLLYDTEVISGGDYLDIDVSGISCDTRAIKEKEAFVCLAGTKENGHARIKEAFGKGASVCIVQYGEEYDKAAGKCVSVKNTRASLAFMQSRFYGNPGDRVKLFAVTGTNGKTSTSIMLRDIFINAGIKTGLIGTLKCFIGKERMTLDEADSESISTMTTPDPAQLYRVIAAMSEAGAENIIIEASSHALFYDKLAPLHFKKSVFTNLSPEHLDFHKTMEEYRRAKLKLGALTDMAFFNTDSAPWEEIYGAYPKKKRRFFTETGKDKESLPGVFGNREGYCARDIRMLGMNGTEYTLASKKHEFGIKSSIPGAFTVYNTLAAASLALEEGIHPIRVQEAIRALEVVDGRLEKVKLDETKHRFSVYIDYAHTEKAMENLLKTVSEAKYQNQRLITLFGCGGDRDKSKRAPMGAVAAKYSDFLIITSDNSRSEEPEQIIKEIEEGVPEGADYIKITNRKKAIEYAVEIADENDIVVLAGKGHEQYEIIKDVKTHFSEKEIVEEAAERKHKKADISGVTGAKV